MVRKAAKKASVELKKLRDGWDGDGHYNKVTLAFWWIKQASRLALNLPIDGEGALSVRSSYCEELDAALPVTWEVPDEDEESKIEKAREGKTDAGKAWNLRKHNGCKRNN
jgi:hypothetical protein